MSDERTYTQALNERMKAEIAAFEADQRAKAQMQLDYWQEQKLIERAAAWRGETSNGVVSEYNPFAAHRMNR